MSGGFSWTSSCRAPRQETKLPFGKGGTDRDIYGLLILLLGLASSRSHTFSPVKCHNFGGGFMSFNVVLPVCGLLYQMLRVFIIALEYPEGQVALWVQSHSDGLLCTGAPPHNRLSFACRNQHGLFGLLSHVHSCQSVDQPVH